MPPGGGPTRAAQVSTLEEIAHAYPGRRALRRALRGARAVRGLAAGRLGRREPDSGHQARLGQGSPGAEASSHPSSRWRPPSRTRGGCRRERTADFASFRPSLERIIELRRRYVECFAPYDDPYDALLDDFEPGMKTDEVREIFAILEPELVSLVAAHATDEEDAFLRGPFSIEAQAALSRELIERFGATWDQFRLDTTVHPFETTFGLGDIRLTTRYTEDDLNSLFTAMHEGGHGLYEWGVSPTLERTPLCAGCSAALHESQSRLWENVVGRSLPFWRWFYPRAPGGVPGQARRRCPWRASTGRSTAPVDLRPGRRGRDELRLAHHPPVRARAGAHLGPPRGRRTSRTPGTPASRS